MIRRLLSILVFFLVALSAAANSKRSGISDSDLRAYYAEMDSLDVQPMDSAAWQSIYGNGTCGVRVDIRAAYLWTKHSSDLDKRSNDTGLDLEFGVGYRFSHYLYAGLTLDLEMADRLSFAPMAEGMWTLARSPLSPYVSFATGPYISYVVFRHWTFQPSIGLSLRGKHEMITHFGFGMRLFDDKGDWRNYVASVGIEF